MELHATHFKLRSGERAAPDSELKNFDPSVWALVSAEVRTDTGKSVNSAWKVNVGGRRWRVIIGLQVTVETAFVVTHERSLGGTIIRSGLLYRYVDKVNHELLEGDARL